MNWRVWATAALAVCGIASMADYAIGPAGAAAPADTFVGSAKCGTCHAKEFASWKDTYHAKMVRSSKDGLLKEAAEAWEKDAKGNAGPTKGNVDKKPYTLADVEMVVGSKWKQRYLVKNAITGNHQFLDKQWNSYTKLWEGYGNDNDWESNCTTCHTTGYKLTAYDPAKPEEQKSAFSETNVGCEACHGPGAAHIASRKKTDIFNPKNGSKAEADKVCGYCHIRAENYAFQTVQKHPREDLPAPVVGQSFRAGKDDWTTWYPDKVLLVGIQPEDPVNKAWPKTDLNDAFFIDDAAKESGFFEARKHHQQYQEFLQSKHAKSGVVGCGDCHSAHSVKGKTIDPVASCAGCHGDKYKARDMMPGLGRTVDQLYMRSHTFNPNPRKSAGATSSDLKEPVYANR